MSDYPDTMVDNLFDEPDYDEGPVGTDCSDSGKLCHHCHLPTVGETCGFCGNDLCPACFEMGGGFCGETHTQEQIDAYEDEVYPPANAEEAAQRKRKREVRKELKRLGVL